MTDTFPRELSVQQDFLIIQDKIVSIRGGDGMKVCLLTPSTTTIKLIKGMVLCAEEPQYAREELHTPPYVTYVVDQDKQTLKLTLPQLGSLLSNSMLVIKSYPKVISFIDDFFSLAPLCRESNLVIDGVTFISRGELQLTLKETRPTIPKDAGLVYTGTGINREGESIIVYTYNGDTYNFRPSELQELINEGLVNIEEDKENYITVAY